MIELHNPTNRILVTKLKKKIAKTLQKGLPFVSLRIRLLRLAGYKIGKKVYVGESFRVSDLLGERNNLEIGDRVSIAPRVTIVTSSSPNHSLLVAKYPMESKPVVIENDVWLGTGVIILQGVTIGECSVIAAGSVVLKDIPPYSVAAGSPAKVIKQINKNEINLNSQI